MAKNKKKQKPNCLQPALQEGATFFEMRPDQVVNFVPRLIRELLQHRINLAQFAPYLLNAPYDFKMGVLTYLSTAMYDEYQEYNAQMSYGSKLAEQYYQFPNGSLEQQNYAKLYNLAMAKAGNAQAKSNVYSDMYNGFQQFFTTGNYANILPMIAKNEKYASLIQAIDNTPIQYIQRELRNNGRQHHNNYDKNKKGGQRNDQRRAERGNQIPRRQ